MPLDEAHAVCDEIEAAIKKQIANCDITIHAEPCNNYHDDFEKCPDDCPFQEKENNQS
jgi:divalent metal cation (Fe/Co/Zn/Cd) transporter